MISWDANKKKNHAFDIYVIFVTFLYLFSRKPRQNSLIKISLQTKQTSLYSWFRFCFRFPLSWIGQKLSFSSSSNFNVSWHSEYDKPPPRASGITIISCRRLYVCLFTLSDFGLLIAWRPCWITGLKGLFPPASLAQSAGVKQALVGRLQIRTTESLVDINRVRGHLLP